MAAWEKQPYLAPGSRITKVITPHKVGRGVSNPPRESVMCGTSHRDDEAIHLSITIPLQTPSPTPRKSFEPTRLLRQVRHRFHLDSAFVLIHP